MTVTKLILTAIVAAYGVSSPLAAQSLPSTAGPTEQPPASFAGNQYVDSAGCVYIRAGVDGRVTWVPRVTRDRKLVCGFKPSLEQSKQNAALKVENIEPVSATLATAPGAPVQPVKAMRKTAQDRSAKHPMRPQLSQQRVLPVHVYRNQINTLNLSVPKGYRRVWEDDRLNPRRAEQTLEGIANTKLIWTDTVPRRLVDPKSGRDLTAETALVYPYTDAVAQQRAQVQVELVEKNGKTYKRVSAGAPLRPAAYSTRSAQHTLRTDPEGR